MIAVPAPGARLSEHFTLAEMLESPTARRDAGLWRLQLEGGSRAGVLAHLTDLAAGVLEPLRAAVGGWPILVTSGYRSRPLNALIGGSETSQHCRGLAADIRLAPGYRRAQETLRARQQLRVDWGQIVDRDVRAMAEPTMPRDWYLWAAAATRIGELPIHQLIHEFGEPWAPAWVHVGARAAHWTAPRGTRVAGPEPRRELMAIGDWTGGGYRRWSDLPAMARDMVVVEA